MNKGEKRSLTWMDYGAVAMCVALSAATLLPFVKATLYLSETSSLVYSVSGKAILAMTIIVGITVLLKKDSWSNTVLLLESLLLASEMAGAVVGCYKKDIFTMTLEVGFYLAAVTWMALIVFRILKSKSTKRQYADAIALEEAYEDNQKVEQ